MEKMDSPERKYAHIVVLLELLPRKFNYFKDRAKIINLLGSSKWAGGSASEQVDIILRQAKELGLINSDFRTGNIDIPHSQLVIFSTSENPAASSWKGEGTPADGNIEPLDSRKN
ncbi:hypothetical protein A3B87_01010 [Candidatus Kuenenbacteria bacterium RIFCSPHIGHO2_02_FULL_39_13]|uniref:Uncharacterized protein n=1 Tax=Candidatus Kuenenbacteria bacterium RIFCSPHIGHO2_02_FULL_39_13 TaxID=1798561 RepID=A0A1F6FPA4_9BACT|nr:MAG: hypothetical protein A3B87_01010 [Candidatus Kuenenbacteria bacterium RIFCSPHIGHO2_02_FULL_39_13]